MIGLFVLLCGAFYRKSILTRALNTHYQANSLTLGGNLNKSELLNHGPKIEISIDSSSLSNVNYNDTEVINYSNGVNDASYNQGEKELIPYDFIMLNDQNKGGEAAELVGNSYIETSSTNSVYSNILNIVDIIYNEWEDNDVSLYEYYKPIYTHEHIKNSLYHVIAITEIGINNIWGKLANYSKKIKNFENSCEEIKKELSMVIENLENPIYNYQNQNFQNAFSLLKKKRADLIQCIKSKYSTLNNDINEIKKNDNYYMYNVMRINPPLTLVPVYNIRIDLIKNEINDLKKITKLPLNEVKNVSNFINQITNIVENEPELKNNLDTIKFMQKEINHIIKLYEKHTNICNIKYNIIMGLQKIDNAYKTHTYHVINNIFDLGNNYAIFKYSYNILTNLDKLYNNKKTQINNIFNFLTQILIGKVDPSSNKIVHDDSYDYDMSQPKQILNNLKYRFHKAFGQNVNSYDKNVNLKDYENGNNDLIAQIMLLINKLEDLIKLMEKIYNNDTPISEIQTEIYNKTNKVDLNEKLDGFNDALKEATMWKTKRKSTISTLKDKYELVLNLQTQINELYQPFNRKYMEQKYIQESKHILKMKVKHINEKKNDLEKLIELKKDIENHINQINILLNNPLYEMVDFANKKNKINDDIKLEFKKFYNDGVENLVAECSTLIDENMIASVQNDEQVKKYLGDLDAKYDKINNITFDEFSKVLNNVNNKKESLLELINEIKGYIYYHMIHDLSSILNSVQTIDERLKPNINNYFDLYNELTSYKEELLKKKNLIVQNDYINNGNYPDYEHDSKKLLEYSNNFISKENIILKDIEEMSKISDEVKTVLPKYDNEAKKIYPNSNDEYLQTKKIIEQIKEYTSEDYLNKYRKEVNDIKTTITDETNQIQNINKNIENYKILNNGMQQYQSIYELIKNTINGKNILNDLLSQSIQAIQNYDNVNETIKNSSIETLNNKISMIDDKLSSTTINDIETKLSTLKEYFISVKQKIMENSEIEADNLLQNANEINQVQNSTNALNEQYISLKMDIEKLINDINEEIRKHQN
ncbi:reticulocyte binding protein, putative [Plasmodium berghei]|uniref:Reticulocyte binding protein, putative n=2 Tax=Plasmodium berghei TaxID=5821 RepID=A0A509AH40_PLABA|nr:reticulocyte binding protein, putative [Plasmodium berghei ANKA]CXI22429.1 reticulocyte binding protein, putative [Plasmodium berghei]SCM20097.1 reticulocyte binding protein, putative [Plasmodium berghei]SCN23743.1 reticulocyte binding protein, putative [Plasmodium berghei]SCO60102.1 reticulocyte binding protein, putative [Plasmodium berghei]VUC54936.1 reticulocyte binding protein, putative [Plasmodium berghei ANKA]|eukprot:XP_034420756.1 reticulocyte binding protein, putative [Plasmodium berghei ANKA]